MTSETKPEEERLLESGDVQCRCCGAFKSLTPPNSVCYRSINDDAPIEHEWPSSPEKERMSPLTTARVEECAAFASEQFDNATNIAAVKRGSDRDDWLDDAALHRDKAIALRERDMAAIAIVSRFIFEMGKRDERAGSAKL